MPPTVSVIVPCYNEEKTIGLLLASLFEQSYPLSDVEVVIADGLSEDGTRRAIAAFQEQHPDLNLRVVDNLKRTIPAGLNAALAAAEGKYIVRLDAHSVPHREYLARSLAGLEAGMGANVGGVWEITPGAETWIAKSIAAAAAHPLGVGDAKYRYSAQAGVVDTVPFGAFPRALIDQIGRFDETLLANEDYEFNTRIRQQGGRVWFDPAIRAVYFARPTLKALAKQYWRYGFWKLRMLKRYPETIRWRQALPPLFVSGLITGGLLSLFLPLARGILASVVVLYVLALLVAGLQLTFRTRQLSTLIGVPLAICTMHLSWGGAFLWSIAQLARKEIGQ